jgi:Ser/Thr protein kinase RdoA (MazF antagonist)
MDAFGLRGHATSYVEVEGAWSNRVLRLDTTAGRFAVKELRNPWGEPRWAEWLEESWRLERAVVGAGVAVPEPVPAPDGGCFVDVARCDGVGTVPVRVHRWVEGRRPGTADVDLGLAAWTGTTLAKVHALRMQPHDPTLFPVPSTGSVQAWPDLCRQASVADAAWAGLLLSTRDAIRRAGDLLVPPADRPTVMSHGDVSLANVILTASGPVLCDWDVAMPRVPAWDLADVAVTVAGWEARDVARAVRASYLDAGGQVAPPEPHDLGPTLMVRLDFISLLVHRALALRPTTAAQQLEAHAQLPSLLNRLPGQVAVAESLDSWWR